MSLKPFTMWKWDYGDTKPVAVECIPTGKRDHVFMIDADDFQGGRAVWRGSLYEDAEACWKAKLAEAKTQVTLAEQRLDWLRRRYEHDSRKATVA